MSDGPHRSLKMPPKWKKWAKCAETPAFTTEEVGQAMTPALKHDWDSEVGCTDIVVSVERVFGDGLQQSFLPESKAEQLETFRTQVAGMPLGNKFLDNAIYASRQGLDGKEALHEAAKQTLHERGLSGLRQVEEHYCRESNTREAAEVRSRMEAGLTKAALHKLVDKLLSPRAGVKDKHASKQSGVDDGVQL